MTLWQRRKVLLLESNKTDKLPPLWVSGGTSKVAQGRGGEECETECPKNGEREKDLSTGRVFKTSGGVEIHR